MAKLFPLEVSTVCETNATDGGDNIDHQDNDYQDQFPAVCEWPTSNAAIRACDRIKDWSNTICGSQRMLLILTKNLLCMYFIFVIVLWVELGHVRIDVVTCVMLSVCSSIFS